MLRYVFSLDFCLLYYHFSLSLQAKNLVFMTISVIGSGKIVMEVLGMLRAEIPTIIPMSIYAHSNIDNANRIAVEFGIKEVFNDYDKLLSLDKSDFLYIANVNTAHYDYARRALEAGRNVIIEKPICMTLAETEHLVSLARSKQLMLIESVSLLHMPNIELLRAKLSDIGRVHLVECDYSQYSSRYDRYINGDVAPAFNPGQGGGALRDLNVYNINFVIALFGAPRNVKYVANRGFNDVDTSGILLLQYTDFLCVCSAGKDCHGLPYGQIHGERGVLRVDGPVSVLNSFYTVCHSGTKEHNVNTFKHRLAHEFASIERMFMARDYAAFNRYQDISLAVMKVIEEASAV